VGDGEGELRPRRHDAAPHDQAHRRDDPRQEDEEPRRAEEGGPLASDASVEPYLHVDVEDARPLMEKL
jgi:hypothetical protein